MVVNKKQSAWAWVKICRSWASVLQFELPKSRILHFLQSGGSRRKIEECLFEAVGCASGIASPLAHRLNKLSKLTEINKNKSSRDADLRDFLKVLKGRAVPYYQ